MNKFFCLAIFLVSASAHANELSQSLSASFHKGVSLGYPSLIELNVGSTLCWEAKNPENGCRGLLLDVGISPHTVRYALGYRMFYRVDWPLNFQINAFQYVPFSSVGDDSFFSGKCSGLEVGYGQLIFQLRAGLMRCAQGNVLPQIHAGVFW